MPNYSKTEFEEFLNDPIDLLFNNDASYIDLNRANTGISSELEINVPKEIGNIGDIVISEAMSELAIIYISVRARLGEKVHHNSKVYQATYELIYGGGAWNRDKFHRRKGSNPFLNGVMDFPQRHIVGDSDTFEEDIQNEYKLAVRFLNLYDGL
jgi:hypothetical protein